MSPWMTVVLTTVLLTSPTPVTSTAPIHLPLVGNGIITTPPPLLISALYYDTYLPNEPDEAFQLFNPSAMRAPLAGWQVNDGRRTVTFPVSMTLPAHAYLWCTRRAVSFTLSFGFAPDCEYGGDTDPAVPDLTGSALQFANTGGRVTLLAAGGVYSDVLVYEGGDTAGSGWLGSAAYPFRPSTNFGEEGQILYRKLDQRSGLPVADSDTRADWAAEPEDVINGRKARYAGWSLERFFTPRVVTETATLEVFLAPDHSHAALQALLESAQRSIRFGGYTFESATLGQMVADRARAGVTVEMLLDGGPPGGVSDQQRWVVQQIVQAGGRVYYLRANTAAGIRTRYSYQHGKFWVLDGVTALVGSENPNAGAFPDDDKADGTYGRRGVYLVTGAPSVVTELNAIMDDDIAPGVHRDVWSWNAADPTLGAPPVGFTPSYSSGGIFYTVQKPQPLFLEGVFPFQIIHSPEQALRDQDSLLGLVNRAGPGDTVLVEQLYENTWT